MRAKWRKKRVRRLKRKRRKMRARSYAIASIRHQRLSPSRLARDFYIHTTDWNYGTWGHDSNGAHVWRRIENSTKNGNPDNMIGRDDDMMRTRCLWNKAAGSMMS
ncbi:uncharacterized protein CLUP02_03020 [Colletotrichum lupini]|uniref:60S ribosomal protein L41 n=1 Tax=Colletotrichum lupini TaxID=145971 RepID=A0A9Q8SHN7_9PEZI|nr:uncharacterized protein CLUP02_03020 [Colletotrichum lupini]UQC77551.1 hypothetical protein CLUP02_03020 [Colletotrichum lupini]